MNMKLKRKTLMIKRGYSALFSRCFRPGQFLCNLRLSTRLNEFIAPFPANPPGKHLRRNGGTRISRSVPVHGRLLIQRDRNSKLLKQRHSRCDAHEIGPLAENTKFGGKTGRRRGEKGERPSRPRFLIRREFTCICSGLTADSPFSP